MFAESQAQKARPPDPAWAWAPYRPDDRRPWNLARAGHLFRRAGFGADWGTLRQALADGPEAAVGRLLRPEADTAAFNRQLDEYESAGAGAGSAEGLRSWWLRRMIQTPHPLLEKMTLFWHGHLATSNAKVQNAQLVQQHVALLRKHALGRFDALLAAVSRDPAMLVWLGSDANRKAQPSEHFARALFEQFTLGPGNFTEEDVQEAARALTGWFVLRGRLRYYEREHDAGTKRVLGRVGKFGVDDVVRIVLGQSATPRFLVRKLYRWLISETDEPDDKLIAPLAESLARDYDVSRVVETMLRSNLLFSEAAYRRRVKGPVEFAVGIVRGLEGLVPTERLGADLAALGQNLYHPPTTLGWQGGRHWINQSTLVGRSKLARALLAPGGPYGGKLDPAALAARHGHASPESAGPFLLDLFLGGDVPEAVRTKVLQTAPASGGANAPARIRRLAHAVLTLPEFHLA